MKLYVQWKLRNEKPNPQRDGLAEWPEKYWDGRPAEDRHHAVPVWDGLDVA